MKAVLIAYELKIVTLTGHALLETQTLCLVKHATAMKAIFTTFEGRKTAEEALNLKVNIIRNTRRQRNDVIISEGFDRRVEREKGD